MKSRVWLCIVLFGNLALHQHALANAGTPLIWAGILHLVFGNAIIGIGEGILLAWRIPVPRRKSNIEPNRKANRWHPLRPNGNHCVL